jgi:RimJ/RimL family protein N-acetyltransferase
MFNVLNDPTLYAFTGDVPPANPQSLFRRYEYWEKRISPDGMELWLNWALRQRAHDQLIGHLQAGVVPDHADMAWIVGSRWQRQGYAKEAARAVLDFLDRLGVREVRASIHPQHTASIKIAEHLGMRQAAGASGASGSELIWKRLYAGHPTGM